jgi:23S rRNA pseudouridine1911/1915/1917 synthase
MSGALTVLWEDHHGLAVDKPAGWLTQGPAGGEPTVESLVRAYLRADDPASAYVGTVHRLDRPVSGVILWAKTPKAARRWADQFARRVARKEYWAIVEGVPLGPGSEGDWEDWLTAPDAEGRARIVENPSKARASLAATHYEVGRGTSVRAGFTWLKLRPGTGRTHQLRAQSAEHLGPIVGDVTYGSSQPFPRGIALHARSLTIEHPVERRPITIEAPLPESWSDWLRV